MLRSILNDAQLSSETSFCIVLLPPIASNSIDFSCPSYKSYLESHVIHVPWGFTLTRSTNSRLKLIKKKIQIDPHDNYAQLMLSVNDTMYETSSGCISCCNNKRKAKIIHSELLYTLPANPNCTHLLLYMDQPIIDFVYPLVQRQQQPGHLSFKEMVRRILPANNSNDVIHKIDLLVLKFCDTSNYCDSLQSLHDCMDEILYEGYDLIESLDSNAMALLNLDHLPCGEFESYFMDLTYDVAFFKITQLLLPQDKMTTWALEDMEHLDFSQIALPTSITDPRQRVCNAIASFERIGSFRTPAEKLDCLLMTVSELTQDSDSDSLIPLLLMTLIRSKVPHLTANLNYMRDYTFERNTKTGKYGYALSTFEGVLEYILDAHPYLSRLSKQNVEFWASIKTGDIAKFRHILDDEDDDNDNDVVDILDFDGNNALMIACLYGQADIAAELLIRQQNQVVVVTNDQNKTPLMAAIQSRSIDTIHTLFKYSAAAVQASLDTVDCFGNTAALYACSTNDLSILRAVVQQSPLLDQVNWQTGDTSLHVAARHGGSMDFIMSIMMQHVENSKMTRKKNGKGETFYHLCGNLEYIKHAVLQDPSMIIHQVDHLGRTPMMTWAANGRLDLVEAVLPNYGTRDFARVDKDGRTLLHLMALHLGRHVVSDHGSSSSSSLSDMIKKMRHVVNVRDWCHGNTALHIAAETSAHNLSNARAFIQALVKYGAAMDAVNLRDEQPVNVCRIPELTAYLDELHLKTHHGNKYQYTWAVTRPLIQQQQNGSEVSYFIKSGQMDKPHTMHLVNRKLQDFSFLRTELLYEMPELFLPTFNNASTTIDLRPPPFALVDATLMTLQSFMDWLQCHPILKNHDLVMSFVRSSCGDLQKSAIRNNSFSRRSLMLEKIKEMPVGHHSKDEAYFLTYAQESMMPLKDFFLNVVLAARKLQHTGLELERNMMLVAQDALTASTCLEASEMFACNTVAIETIQVCANVAFEKSYVSPWLGLIQASQMAYAMIDGILLSLQKPFYLIDQRCALRETIELQKEMLRTKASSWHSLFSAKERKKRMEEGKEKVIHNMNKLNDMDGQINEAHRLISDELAHFQTMHPKKMITTLGRFAKSTLAMERHKLSVLEHAMETWEQNP